MIAKSVRNASDMSPVMKGYSEYLVTQTDDRFRSETGPDGKKWQALSPVTKAAKAKAGKIDKILQQDGYLRLVHPESDRQSAGVYSNRVYAAIHNRGGKAGRGRKVTIPKREFLGINDADMQEFEATVVDWIVLGRRPS